MYKYKIHYLLSQLTYCDYTIAMKWLPKQMGISQATWRRYIYLPSDSTMELSYKHLSALSSFFECSIKDLHSNPKVWDLSKEFRKLHGVQQKMFPNV